MSKKIKTFGMVPGLVLKPKTKINKEILNSIYDGFIESVLIMTVGNIFSIFLINLEPGFGG